MLDCRRARKSINGELNGEASTWRSDLLGKAHDKSQRFNKIKIILTKI